MRHMRLYASVIDNTADDADADYVCFDDDVDILSATTGARLLARYLMREMPRLCFMLTCRADDPPRHAQI